MASAKPTGGAIRIDESYPLPDFMRINGFGRKTLASARRNGLRVVRVGRNSYVLGADWHDYLRKLAPTA